MEQKERALAHIEKIEWIKPIEGADNIELIGILGWICIAKKDEFKQGDLAVYIEIDSKCPESDERFAFLQSKHYKVKTMKLGKFKVISQGLALPISLFPELHNKTMGSDVTNDLKITYASEDDIKRKSNKVDPEAKYKAMANRRPDLFKRPIVRTAMKYKIGRRLMFLLFGKKKDNPKEFPKWIVKTDETRIENAPFYLNSTSKFIKTEKLDGTSCTFAVDRLKKGKDKFDFIVCSRNVRQADREQSCYHELNIYWELADKYNIKKILTGFASENGYNKVVLQGEGVGFVQGNPYKLKENNLYVFNLIVDGIRFGTMEMAEFCKQNDLNHIPIIDEAYTLPKTMEEMKVEADGYSEINTKVKREGFVYRSIDGQQSFKNVSREYLLKHNG
ncbi:RNA ligase family protein [Konateibacter massiliensis]|uniref:RNA ligase family protein n=1 Tax=Konateibacter massiliensis TaxID=2002841 RepID=UPI000C14B870|nr:RNA ligase family protein [Konateibacter massiliensis]